MTDTIVLTIPHERQFHRVAHLVLGGLAVRLNLTVETLEDLQVALDGLLEVANGEADVTLRLGVGDGSIAADIGPFDDEIRRALEPDGNALGLQRVLATVVDGVSVTERDGRTWVRLTKAVAAAEAV